MRGKLIRILHPIKLMQIFYQGGLPALAVYFRKAKIRSLLFAVFTPCKKRNITAKYGGLYFVIVTYAETRPVIAGAAVVLPIILPVFIKPS